MLASEANSVQGENYSWPLMSFHVVPIVLTDSLSIAHSVVVIESSSVSLGCAFSQVSEAIKRQAQFKASILTHHLNDLSWGGYGFNFFSCFGFMVTSGHLSLRLGTQFL